MAPWILWAGGALLGAAALASSNKRQRQADEMMAEVHLLAWIAANTIGVPLPRVERGGPFATAQPGIAWFNPVQLRARLAQYCSSESCRRAVLLGLVSHEVAHTACPVPAHHNMARQQEEHRADWWSGYVLGRQGIPVDELERVIGDLSRRCSVTHGNDFERIAHIRDGYAAGAARQAA